jgi:hypothetical protein
MGYDKRFYQSIDLDTKSWKRLRKVLKEIRKCPNLLGYSYNQSTNKHFHIHLWCDHLCYICRIRFDDIFRLNADITNRMYHQQNITFTKKQKIKLRRKKS